MFFAFAISWDAGIVAIVKGVMSQESLRTLVLLIYMTSLKIESYPQVI